MRKIGLLLCYLLLTVMACIPPKSLEEQLVVENLKDTATLFIKYIEDRYWVRAYFDLPYTRLTVNPDYFYYVSEADIASLCSELASVWREAFPHYSRTHSIEIYVRDKYSWNIIYYYRE